MVYQKKKIFAHIKGAHIKLCLKGLYFLLEMHLQFLISALSSIKHFHEEKNVITKNVFSNVLKSSKYSERDVSKNLDLEVCFLIKVSRSTEPRVIWIQKEQLLCTFLVKR